MVSSGPGLAVRRMGRVDGVVLAKWVTLPVLGEKDPPQIRMAVEADPEQVVALPLHPQGAPEQTGQARARRLPADARLEGQAQPALEVLEPADDVEPVRLPVHGGEVAEEAAAEPVAGPLHRLGPALDGHGGHEMPRVGPLGVLPDRLDPQLLADRGEGGVERHRPGQSGFGAAAGRRPVFWNSATFSWSFRMPNISDSGVGGQPGT